MREMKDSGIGWLKQIPASWKMVLLSSVVKERKHKNAGMQENNLLSLSYGNVIRKNINTTDGLLPESFEGYNIIENGDVVLRLTDLQNDHTSLRTGLAKERGIITSAYTTLIADAQYFLPRYLHYQLHSFDICKGFYGMGAGVRQGLNFEGVKKIALVLPNLNEQEQIAVYLDRRCATIDTLIANQQQQIEKLKQYKQAVITEAVTRGLEPNVQMKDSGVEWIGQVPEHWSVARIKWLLRERKERSETGLEEPLSMSQKYGLIPTKQMDIVPNMASSFIGAKLTYCNDLVFNKLKAHLGVFSVSHYDGLVSPDYAVYYSTGVANLRYLEYLFKTPQCIGEFRKKSTGIAAGLTRLYTDDLFSIECPLPEKAEQDMIAEYLDTKCAQIDALIAVKQQKADKLAQYKKSLIYEVVTGKREISEGGC